MALQVEDTKLRDGAGMGGVERREEWRRGWGEGRSVVPRCALHSGRRQSGSAFGAAVYGTAEAVPFRAWWRLNPSGRHGSAKRWGWLLLNYSSVASTRPSIARTGHPQNAMDGHPAYGVLLMFERFMPAVV